MLNGIQLRHFKAFDDLKLDLRPITVLLGPNNSGKSSILASVRLLVQTVESFDMQVPLLLNGIMGDFGTYKDIVFGNHRGRPIGISLSATDVGMQHRGAAKGEELWSAAGEIAEIDLTYKYRPKLREVVLRNIGLSYRQSLLLSTVYSEDSGKHLIEKIRHKEVPHRLKSTLSRSLRLQNFLPRLSGVGLSRNAKGGASEEFLTKSDTKTLSTVDRASRSILYALRLTDYIGAMRVPPSRTYLFSGERRRRIGSSGENAASILALDSARGRGVSNASGDWLKLAEMASDFQVKALSDRHYEIRVQHPATEEYENLADVGYGNSQILPVLVGGYSLDSGATYMVEEPEIHLHPRAQAKLGNFFLDLYRKGVQSIVETHSEHLILGLQQLVASGEIQPEHVLVYYVYATKGRKVAEPLRLDSGGRFIDDWPEGFFPEILEEAKKLSKIRFQRDPKLGGLDVSSH